MVRFGDRASLPMLHRACLVALVVFSTAHASDVPSSAADHLEASTCDAQDSSCHDDTSALQLNARKRVGHELRDSWRFVPPITRDVVANGVTRPGYVLEFASGDDITTFECIAGYGALITAFKYNGINMILNTATGPSEVWGSTFWTSPQADWGWPPPDAFESTNYTAEVDEAAMSVTLSGPVASELGIRIVKRFSVDLSKGAIELRYTIERDCGGTGPANFAPWEITRLHPTGLTFYPQGSGEPQEMGGFDLVPVTTKYGITWFNNSNPNLTSNKLMANASCGWFAHVEDGLAFVKRFPHIQPGSAAAGEGQIEIFAMSDYTEMEQQGKYKEVAPEEPLVWNIFWFLRPLPTASLATIGNSELVELVEQME